MSRKVITLVISKNDFPESLSIETRNSDDTQPSPTRAQTFPINFSDQTTNTNKCPLHKNMKRPKPKEKDDDDDKRQEDEKKFKSSGYQAHENDPAASFLLSLVPLFNKMTIQQQLAVKKKIVQIFIDEYAAVDTERNLNIHADNVGANLNVQPKNTATVSTKNVEPSALDAEQKLNIQRDDLTRVGVNMNMQPNNTAALSTRNVGTTNSSAITTLMERNLLNFQTNDSSRVGINSNMQLDNTATLSTRNVEYFVLAMERHLNFQTLGDITRVDVNLNRQQDNTATLSTRNVERCKNSCSTSLMRRNIKRYFMSLNPNTHHKKN